MTSLYGKSRKKTSRAAFYKISFLIAAALSVLGLQAYLAHLSYGPLLPESGSRFLPPAPLRERGVAASASDPGDLEQVDQKIDLNSAPAELLEQLPGIGKKTAIRIMEYRTRIGPFESIEEVMRVNGIGPGKFEQIRSRVTVRPVN